VVLCWRMTGSMGNVGGRIVLSAVIGLLGGLVVGFLLATLLHEHSYAYWGFVLVPTIFGALVGGFLGGISRLGTTEPGE
jgi:uncharacterized membrane protein YeaQ/YmgE (transglycosylase-associated protein family)